MSDFFCMKDIYDCEDEGITFFSKGNWYKQDKTKTDKIWLKDDADKKEIKGYGHEFTKEQIDKLIGVLVHKSNIVEIIIEGIKYFFDKRKLDVRYFGGTDHNGSNPPFVKVSEIQLDSFFWSSWFRESQTIYKYENEDFKMTFTGDFISSIKVYK